MSNHISAPGRAPEGTGAPPRLPASPQRDMTLLEAVRSGVRQFAEFRGRAGRSEFWWWALFAVLVTAMLGVIPFDETRTSGSPYVAVWSLVVLLPTLAVAVRRLRDTGRSWGHVLWILLPVAGLVTLAVLLSRPSTPVTAGEPVLGRAASEDADAEPTGRDASEPAGNGSPASPTENW